MTFPDKEVLFFYSERARMRLKDMAQELQKTSPRLKYTIAVLEQMGLLYAPYSIFDYSYFGQIVFRVYFKGGYVAEKDKADILKKLEENPFVISIYELTGEYDLAVEMAAPNPSRFNKEIKKITESIPTLNNYKIILNVVTRIYPRSYLTKKSHAIPDIIVGGDRNVEQFKPDELKVMRWLLENPKIRFSALAKVTQLNIKTVMGISKNLQKRKVIKGFKYNIDTYKLNINKFRLFLNLHNLSQEREEKLMNYLLETNEIVQMNRTVGDWDLEVDIEAMEKSRIRALILQLREEFKDLIQTFNIIEFYQIYKRSFLPKYLFED